MTVRAQRAQRTGSRCQAVIEIGLILPVMLALLCGFVGLMVQVSAEEVMVNATRLAATSVFQAPLLAVDGAGTTCCGGPAHVLPPGLSANFSTAGFPTRCRYAEESFYGDLSAYSSLLNFQGHEAPFCRSDGSTAFAGAPPPPKAALSCDIYYQDRRLYAPSATPGPDPYNSSLTVTVPPTIKCTTTATIEISRTPVAWIDRWDPVVTFTTEVVPPTFRQ